MVRFVLFGTGSSDLYPSPWCGCDYCARAREQDEHDWRHFSTALLYPDLLIDCPPDLPHAALKAGIELYKVRHLLVTHLIMTISAPTRFCYAVRFCGHTERTDEMQ